MKTRNNKPIWELMKQFINIKKENQQIRRIEFFKFIYQDDIIVKFMLNCKNSIDTYIGYLKAAKFLTTVSRGIYIKTHNIKLPKKLSVKMIREIAYGDQWKSWFIPLEDHIKLLVEGKKDANISGQK